MIFLFEMKYLVRKEVLRDDMYEVMFLNERGVFFGGSENFSMRSTNSLRPSSSVCAMKSPVA